MTSTLTPSERSLASALAAAKQAARAAQPGDDGGTANLDCAFLPAERGMTAERMRRAAEAAGVSVSRSRGRWWNGWFVHVSEGQGAMRTRMAEAAAKALTAAGHPASVYYQID